MKTLSIFLFSTLFCLSLSAQGEYEKAMGEALEKFGSSHSISDMQATASMFERIGEVETSKWLPSYYASFIYCLMSFRTEDPENKEQLLRQADLQLEKAMQVAPEESEIYTLQGMIYTSYLTINPGVNGSYYMPKAHGAFETAIKLNPNNPRAYYMQATMILYTPEEYGGGKAAALPELEKAMELFDQQRTDQPFMPDWGRDDCENNLKICKGEE